MKRAYKDDEKARRRDAMLLDRAVLTDLLDHLDERLTDRPCDHTLRITRAWAVQHEIDETALAESLAHFGGYCDCEVLSNVDPEEIV